MTKQIVYHLHQDSIIRYGGLAGSLKDTDSKIESILSMQYPIFGVDSYPSVLDKE